MRERERERGGAASTHDDDDDDDDDALPTSGKAHRDTRDILRPEARPVHYFPEARSTREDFSQLYMLCTNSITRPSVSMAVLQTTNCLPGTLQHGSRFLFHAHKNTNMVPRAPM